MRRESPICRPESSGLIKFIGPARSIDTLSYYQILDDEHPVPAERIRDRIVLVGRELQASPAPLGQTDLFPTPFFGSSGVYTSGVEIQANIIHNLLTGQWVREISPTVKLIACFGYFLLFSLMFTALSPLKGLIALGVSSLGLSALCYWLFQRFWISGSPPVMFVFGTASIYTGNVVLQYLAEAKAEKMAARRFQPICCRLRSSNPL